MCEEFREVSGSILGSARFLNTLQDAIVGHQDVPYLVRLGFIDFILSLLRRFKEEEDSRDNVLSAIRFETWSYFTTSFLRNTHGNIYHCRYLELLLYVLDYEHEDALNVLLEKCKIVDLFLRVYEDDDDSRGKVCTSRTDAKGHVLQFFKNLRASPLSEAFLKSHQKWNMFSKSRLDSEIRLNSVDGAEEEEEVISRSNSVIENLEDSGDDEEEAGLNRSGSVVENDVDGDSSDDEEEDVGGGLD